MEFKLLVAVCCLVSIHMSEAATLSPSPCKGTATVSECADVGTTITWAKPTVTGGTGPYAYGTTLAHSPTATPLLFAINAAGTITTTTTPFSSSTTPQYLLDISLTDTGASGNSGTFPLVVTVQVCTSRSATVIPSVAVLVLAMLSILFQKK